MIERPPKPIDQPPSLRFKKRTKSSHRLKPPNLEIAKSGPTIEESKAAWKEIREASPRAFAILAVTYVESVLRVTIASRFVLLAEDELKRLYNFGSPLNSFSQAIELGFALGLYHQTIHRDLTIVRVIRNVFAHTRKPLSFDTPDIANEIANLQYLKTVKGKPSAPVGGITSDTLGPYIERGLIFPTNREKYIETCMFIASALSTQIDFSLRPRNPHLP